MARLLDESGEHRRARPYHLVLNLTAPARATFTNLVKHLFEMDDIDTLDAFLLGGDPEAANEDLDEAIRTAFLQILERDNASESVKNVAFLRALRRLESSGHSAAAGRVCTRLIREKWQRVPGLETYRFMFLGELFVRREQSATTESEKNDHRERAIAHYEDALEAFEQEGTETPVLLLNNFAWCLAEDPTEERRRRGLELARRARDRFPSSDVVPGVQDTYAWALYRNQRLAEARAEFETLNAKVANPTFRYHLARVLGDLAEYDRALKELDSAIEFPASDFAEKAQAIDLRREIYKKREGAKEVKEESVVNK